MRLSETEIGGAGGGGGGGGVLIRYRKHDDNVFA